MTQILPISFNLINSTNVRAVYKGSWRFYVCNKNGKLEIDVDTVRHLANNNVICKEIIETILKQTT